MGMNEIVKEIMKEEGITQAKLAEICGYKTQGFIAQKFNYGLTIEATYKLLTAMGYECVFRKKGKKGAKEYVIEK